jgi:hypothetical protein
MYQGMRGELTRIGDAFQSLITCMSKEQVEYDIGSEDIMARHGSIQGDRFVVGRRRYHTVILPPYTENLNSKTLACLDRFLQNGGHVLCCGEPPVRVDGRESGHVRTLAKSPHWQNVSVETLLQKTDWHRNDRFEISRTEGDCGILFHQRRQLEDGQLLFLVNTSTDSPATGTIESACLGVEQWNPQTGEIVPYPFSDGSGDIKADFRLEPCGSLLLFLSNQSGQVAEPFKTQRKNITAAGPLTASRVRPNVLTLDYVDVSAGDQQRKNLYFYQANQFVFQQNGLDRNPWDSAVQFRDEIISKTFDQKSGFTAEYHFTIDKELPSALWIVIERADLYSIMCNGKRVAAAEGMWWLDKSFGRIDITPAAKLGENTVQITASPFTVLHELEPAYVIGEFALVPTKSGLSIVGSASDIQLGGWNAQGCPFYAEGVSYVQQFELIKTDAKYIVELGQWYGSVAEVKANGRLAGHIAYRPWQCDITDFVVPGINTVEVRVIGTLKNTLGPHHAGDGVGSAWPSMFQKAPGNGPPAGENYHSIGYGLFEPFTLKQIIREPVKDLVRETGSNTKLKHKIALTTFPAQIQECKGAIRFLHARASEFGLAPEAFGVWGGSAGGILAALKKEAGQ